MNYENTRMVIESLILVVAVDSFMDEVHMREDNMVKSF